MGSRARVGVHIILLFYISITSNIPLLRYTVYPPNSRNYKVLLNYSKTMLISIPESLLTRTYQFGSVLYISRKPKGSSMKIIARNDELPPRRIKVGELRPSLDPDRFNHLYRILRSTYKHNASKCARICGVSRATWIRWAKYPPTWWYWNNALLDIIKLSVPIIIASHGYTKIHRDRLQNSIEELPRDGFATWEYIHEEAANITGSVYHLRELLEQHPEGLPHSKLKLPAYSGGYSQRTLHAASIILQVIKVQEGFGHKKKSRWFMPIEDEEDNIQSV